MHVLKTKKQTCRILQGHLQWGRLLRREESKAGAEKYFEEIKTGNIRDWIRKLLL